MKKTYEPETKRAIEQVIDVFNDYIRTSTHFELLWSDKVGYIYISIAMCKVASAIPAAA